MIDVVGSWKFYPFLYFGAWRTWLGTMEAMQELRIRCSKNGWGSYAVLIYVVLNIWNFSTGMDDGLFFFMPH